MDMPKRNQLTLYDCETATSPRRVRVFAAEKAAELQKVAVNLAAGEQFSEQFRRINPDCVVPVLVLEDGTRISEVTAICQYLEELHPTPPLFGSTPTVRALVTMWNSKAEQQGLWPAFDVFRNSTSSLAGRALTGPDKYEQISALAERSRARTRAFMARMNKQLVEHEFLAGNDYSIADITGMIFIDFSKRLNIPIPDDAEALKQWYAAVSARPSAAA